MHRASNAFSVLQATAATVGLAILLWSVGLPSLRFAEAANVTSYSDTLSTSAPGVGADHEIVFTTPTGVANNQTIVIDFTDGTFNTASVDYTDIDVATTSGQFTLAANCSGSEMASAVMAADILTITMCNGKGGLIAANGTTTILIGKNATGGNANAQIVNASVGSYQIPLTAGTSDTGETRVAIVNTVEVNASVDTVFSFTVGAVNTGQTVNGTTTTGSTTAQLIDFGQLNPGVASTAAQDLTVVTNARNGFVVTVVTDQQLSSANGADIDGFANGTYTSSPSPWTAPTALVGQENTYGHWGITSNDPTVTESLTDEFDTAGNGQDYVSASTTAVEVFRNAGPANGAPSGTGIGTARVGYTVQTSALQEAANDYTATLTYVATPVF